MSYWRGHKQHLAALATEDEEVKAATEIGSKATTMAVITNINFDQLELDDEGDDAVSLDTASTLFQTDSSLALPKLRDLSPDGEPFECPICLTLQVFRKDKAWRCVKRKALVNRLQASIDSSTGSTHSLTSKHTSVPSLTANANLSFSATVDHGSIMS